MSDKIFNRLELAYGGGDSESEPLFSRALPMGDSNALSVTSTVLQLSEAAGIELAIEGSDDLSNWMLLDNTLSGLTSVGVFSDISSGIPSAYIRLRATLSSVDPSTALLAVTCHRTNL
jgi:hypothetical protein